MPYRTILDVHELFLAEPGDALAQREEDFQKLQGRMLASPSRLEEIATVENTMISVG